MAAESAAITDAAVQHDVNRRVRALKADANRGPERLRGSTFTKSDRLLKRSDFVYLSKYGKTARDRYFIIKHHPGNRMRSRLGITVTRKVGQAVQRNAIKRRVREFFRIHRGMLNNNQDLNIIANRAAAEADSKQINASLEKLFAYMNDSR